MKKFFSDVKTAADVFADIRRARKEGTVVEIRKSRVLPVFTAGPCIFDTVEGCTLWNRNKEVFDEIQCAFKALPVEDKKRLAFSPENGEFVERASIWRSLIASVLSPEQTRKAMISILQWYIHIKQVRKRAGKE